MQPKSVVFPLESLSQGKIFGKMSFRNRMIITLKKKKSVKLQIFCILFFSSFFLHLKAQQVVGGMNYLLQVSHAYPAGSADLTGIARQPAAQPAGSHAGIAFFSQKLISTESPGEYLLVFNIPFSGGRVSLIADHMQMDQYRQTQFGIAYAIGLSSSFSIGIKMNYYQQAVKGYRPFRAFPAEMGMMYQVSGKFSSGLAVYNIAYAFRKKSQPHPLPLLIAFGWSLSLSKEVELILTAAWQENIQLSFQPSVRIMMNEKFKFNFGYTSRYSSFFTSGVCTIRNFLLHVGFQYHPQLGMGTGAGIEWFAKQPVVK